MEVLQTDEFDSTLAKESESTKVDICRKLIKKFFVKNLLIFSILYSAVFIVAFNVMINTERVEADKKTESVMEIVFDMLQHDFRTAKSDLAFIVQETLDFNFWLRNDIRIYEEFENGLVNKSLTHGIYDQIRFLNAQGKEIIRVDYNRGQPKATPVNKLQNKSNRYYFQETIKLDAGEVFISRLDLNVEQGKIEQPIKPVVRFSTPIKNSVGELLGIVILNYRASTILDHFTVHAQAAVGKMSLLNQNGYWLSSDDPSKEWGFMYGRRDSLKHQSPSLWQQIVKDNSGSFIEGSQRYIYKKVNMYSGDNHHNAINSKALGNWYVLSERTAEGFNWPYLVSKSAYIVLILIIYFITLFFLWGASRAKAGREVAENEIKQLNETLEQKVANRTRELEATKSATILGFANLADTRDNETGFHIKRTQCFVRILAQELLENSPYQEQLSAEQVQVLEKSAPLHDIGKIGIPDDILLKPGKLTESEFNIMKTHTTIGGKALQEAIDSLSSELKVENSSVFLCFAQEIALYHHERFDGSGYPEGLAGTDIPLSARIMAVADVYDALASKRVYKPAFTRDKVEHIMFAESDGHFDPVIIEALKRRREEFWKISQKFSDEVLK